MTNTIFYGVMGEGLGHATRSLAVIEALSNYEVHVFTSGNAYDFYDDLNYPHLHKIPGLRFCYTHSGSINYLTSSLGLLSFIWNSNDIINYLQAQVKELSPSLCITDYEPLMPRLAKRVSLPCISIDNQHKFLECGLSGLPTKLKVFSLMVALFTKALIPRTDHKIISTFHYDALVKPRHKNVELIDALVREEIVNKETTDEGFLLIYAKGNVGAALEHHVSKCWAGRVKVYGTKSQKYNFEYHDVGSKFVDDLAKCKAVISTAGNQLLGEARCLGKPAFIVPIPNQYEQYVNGFYLNKLGIGKSVYLEDLTTQVLSEFLSCLPAVERVRPQGLQRVVEAVDYQFKGLNVGQTSC